MELLLVDSLRPELFRLGEEVIPELSLRLILVRVPEETEERVLELETLPLLVVLVRSLDTEPDVAPSARVTVLPLPDEDGREMTEPRSTEEFLNELERVPILSEEDEPLKPLLLLVPRLPTAVLEPT